MWAEIWITEKTTKCNLFVMKNIFYFLLILALGSCKAQPKNSPIQLSKEHSVIFLDSIEAGNAIVKDEVDHFFNQINILDMSIQMKKNYEEGTDRNEVLKEYKAYLKKDVLDFSKSEKAYVQKVFKQAFNLCNKISTKIFPKKIKLIKTDASHYGMGAYYTREDCIIIPKDAFLFENEEAFLSTMLHEISHIYTRYNPEKRKELYSLIGFKNIGNPSNLLIKPALKEKILVNPDGVNYAYSIDLKESDGRTTTAIPIVFSKAKEYSIEKPTFFDYLDFSLFKIKIQHAAAVLSDSEGNSTLNMANVPDFFRQITDNTGYIIHPDEIIADNFVFVMLNQQEGGSKKEFSEDGTALLQKIKAVLSE